MAPFRHTRAVVSLALLLLLHTQAQAARWLPGIIAARVSQALSFGRHGCRPSPGAPHSQAQHAHCTQQTSRSACEAAGWSRAPLAPEAAAVVNGAEAGRLGKNASLSHNDSLSLSLGHNDSLSLSLSLSRSAPSAADHSSSGSGSGSGGGAACAWVRTGEGQGYQALAGPAMVVVTTLAGVPLGEYCGRRPRVAAVGIMAALWSAAAAAGGLWCVGGGQRQRKRGDGERERERERGRGREEKTRERERERYPK